METWKEFWNALPLLQNSLVIGVLIGSLAPLIGAYFVLRRIVFLGVTIPQVSSAGIALALLAQGFGWFGLEHAHHHSGQTVPMLGALLFTLLAIICLGALAHRRPDWMEVAVGLTFAFASALSILLLSQSPVAEVGMLNLLNGEIIATTGREVVGTAFLYLLVLGALLVFHKEFLLLAYDREFAISIRIPVARYDLVFYLVAGVAVSVSVLTVGPITTFGYLIFPPMISRLFTRGMTRFFVTAALVGAAASVISLVIAFVLDLPVGPTTVTFLALLYAAAWLAKSIGRLAVGGIGGAGQTGSGSGD